MELFSNYDSGKFRDGKWFCGCNKEAKWHTSSRENTFGQRFARCPRTGRIECEFFLTEVDEPQARLDKTADEPPAAPQTPVSQRTTQTMAATPITDGRSRGNLFGSGGSGGGRRVANLNESPSASRFANPDGGSDDDLAKAVVELLREEGIVLKRSTESRLRHAIGDRVAQHGAARDVVGGRGDVSSISRLGLLKMLADVLG